MDVWLWPLIFVIIAICSIALFATIRVGKVQEHQQQQNDKQISNVVKNNAVTFNPVILAYLLALLFMGIVVFYFYATSAYK